jgi:hypothetical protein
MTLKVETRRMRSSMRDSHKGRITQNTARMKGNVSMGIGGGKEENDLGIVRKEKDAPPAARSQIIDTAHQKVKKPREKT